MSHTSHKRDKTQYKILQNMHHTGRKKDVHQLSTQTYHQHSLQVCTAQWPNSYLSPI
jgi:hypothetical protein